MTRLQLRALIQGLIADNQVGEVSAMDVRDALMAVYDSGILNAGGNGGVMLPIDQVDVDGLGGALLALQNSINLINTTVTPFLWNPSTRTIFLDARMSMNVLHVVNPDKNNFDMPMVEVRSLEANPFDGGRAKLVLGTRGSLANAQWDDFVIELNRGLVSFKHVNPANGVKEELVFEDGHITMPSAPTTPAFNDELVTYEQVKRITNIANQVTSPISTTITRAELITAMNTGGYDFAVDIKFVITADDDSSIVDVTYKSFGDTDQTGLNYKFYANQQTAI